MASTDPLLDLDGFVPFQLSVTANAVSDVIARAYRNRFGLRVPEWRLIAILAQSPGLTPQQVCGRARLDKITVSRAAKALQDRDLIAAQANADDRRSHRLELTATGRDLYRAVAPAALALEAEVLAGLTADERRTLSDLLARVRGGAATIPARGFALPAPVLGSAATTLGDGTWTRAKSG